jgi:hypothetical protein
MIVETRGYHLKIALIVRKHPSLRRFKIVNSKHIPKEAPNDVNRQKKVALASVIGNALTKNYRES